MRFLPVPFLDAFRSPSLFVLRTREDEDEEILQRA